MGEPPMPEPVHFYRAMTDTMSETEPLQSRRFIVGLDFGTSFSSVSVLCLNDPQLQSSHAVLSDIWNICNYPEAPSYHNDNRIEVPTECFYPGGVPKHRKPVTHLKMTYEGEALSNEDQFEQRNDEHTDGALVDSAMNDIDEYEYMDIDNQLGEYYWGYEVQGAMMRHDDLSACKPRRLCRFKLLLDQSNLTRNIRANLSSRLDKIQEEGVISKEREVDIIADYLYSLFQHTREQMRAKYGYTSGEQVEFALCIPAIWTRKACRIMQRAMTAALHWAEFLTEAYHDVDDLFIIHEPEAAAAYVLAYFPDFKAGESFVLLDAGGGTVDAVTYKIAHTVPLKLEMEAVPPAGDLCGSTYLNERFEELIRGRLEDESYLENKEMKIHKATQEFEDKLKRTFDPSKQRATDTLEIDGLRANRDKGFGPHRMYISSYTYERRNQMQQIFSDCLERTSRLMLQQLEQAREKDILVKRMAETYDYFNVSDFPSRAAAVSSGAILQALRKDNGPARTTFSSFGILQDEPYDPKNAAHVAQPRARKSHNITKKSYIHETISWFVNKVRMPGSVTIPPTENAKATNGK
ncbi:hypothetical protein EYZ11_012257 [Aspergillus tanneri]|uniref:Heat shock 70 kDa protein 12A n=1 Tax=Aspergillus tanneri TaxID=1220188 RepID=A0A4V3UMR1_9EURO|nr:hypothetical protein EYZ11_012257 [Aspergillus tanneri]